MNTRIKSTYIRTLFCAAVAAAMGSSSLAQGTYDPSGNGWGVPGGDPCVGGGAVGNEKCQGWRNFPWAKLPSPEVHEDWLRNRDNVIKRRQAMRCRQDPNSLPCKHQLEH